MASLPIERSDRGKLFDSNGFVVIRNFISAEEAATVAENVARFIKEVLPGCPTNTAIYEEKGNPDSIKRLMNMYVAMYITTPCISQVLAVIGFVSSCEKCRLLLSLSAPVHSGTENKPFQMNPSP